MPSPITSSLKGILSGLKRRRSSSRETAQFWSISRGTSVETKIGAVILISETHGEKAATALYSVALHTATSGLAPIIIEAQTDAPSRRPFRSEAPKLFFGIETVRVQASAVSYDTNQPCCCVVINGHKIFADMIISSNDIAPDTATLARSTRAMTNDQTTVVSTGHTWLQVESMLCRMLRLHKIVVGHRNSRNRNSAPSKIAVQLMADSNCITIPSPRASDVGMEPPALASMSRPRRAMTVLT